MFANVSMTGTGIVVYIIGLVLFHSGINFDAGQLEGAVQGAFTLGGFLMMIWGQVSRKDLSWGFWRK